MSDVSILRIAIVLAFLVLAAVIVLTGGKKTPQVRRRDLDGHEPGAASAFEAADEPAAHGFARREPTLAQIDDTRIGQRPEGGFDRIVTLYLAARAGEMLNGADIVVACEKVGLVYGHMGIFHRLDENHPGAGPIFSLANLVRPGSFDLSSLSSLRTPGVSLFMTLPGPLLALDAWETMLPAAQRLTELLDAVLLDEERNGLGRQRIAHLREELRGYDRKHLTQTAKR